MNTRRITLIVSIVLAFGTGLLTVRYLSGLQSANAPATVETRQIVIASQDIQARAKITPEMLTIVQRPVDQIEPGAESDAKHVVNSIALIAIPANSQITSTKIGQQASGGLTARLKPGLRAVTIPVDATKAVNGLIQPGDRVDVFASVPRGSGDAPKTMAIIRGAIVLALNTAIEPIADQSPNPQGGGVPDHVTLGVTTKQAKLLTVADLNTTLRLALRSPDEHAGSEPVDPLQFQDDRPPSGGGNPPPPAAPAAAPPAPTVPAPTPIPVPTAHVTVVEGDRLVSGPQ